MDRLHNLLYIAGFCLACSRAVTHTQSACMVNTFPGKMSQCFTRGEIAADHVPEQTVCVSERKDSCYVCQGGEWLGTGCVNNGPSERHKRGFFKKIFKSVKKIARVPHDHIRRLGSFFKRRPNHFVKLFNTPPSITCPRIPSTIVAGSRTSEAVVRWVGPSVKDRENNVVSTRLTSGKGPGSRFGAGRHTVSYKTTDRWGLSATCVVSFNVQVIRCPALPSIANGNIHCSGTLGRVYGSTCTHRCNPGYSLTGAATLTCQRSGTYTPKRPTCQKIQCSKPAVPAHGKSVRCTDGNRYQSVCALLCHTGYSPSRGANAICTANRKWSQTSWKCEDTVKPIFTNCPAKKINTIDERFRWTPLKATDNSGKVVVKQVQGEPPGSLLTVGLHILNYVASDDAGNTASCVFTVELKQTDCPRPSVNDTDMKFTCNGLTVQSVCQLSCRSGSSVEGSSYISCVHPDNTSYWEPIDGDYPRCFKKSCPELPAPKNGALACDKQLDGTLCQLQCNDGFDVKQGEGTGATFVCGLNSDQWKPSSIVPDCSDLAYPDEYLLPTELYYFWGYCDSPETLHQIKQQFLFNLNSLGISPCAQETCSVDDVDVTCGEEEDIGGFLDFKRKRRAVSKSNQLVHIKMTFRLKNTNRTISPEAAKRLLQTLVEKSKTMMSTNTAMRKLYMKANHFTTPAPRPRIYSGIPQLRTNFGMRKSIVKSFSHKDTLPSFAFLPSLPPPTPTPMITQLKARAVTGSLAMECTPGHVQMDAKSGICVPCSVGTYEDRTKGKCDPCPMNTYQNTQGATSCHLCPQLHTTASTGTTARAECIPLCTADTFSTTGYHPCYPCPPGTYQPNTGATTCSPCPVKAASQRPNCVLKHDAGNTTSIPDDLRVSEFLLTCDSELCLSF
ncbi:sushi, von Willebrand factor type A, EGF and pentraxin domain-containing protein 1-like [Haliotis rubra]|uniref:sushi, von Willebrand factor type A, EGF and pentraxin domain-containing protein 1-like n=1 Tax=Haliotis rubra TaxID=36100 RepID=UPI001EE538D1|nr:sushi, von Willebrand factor type A, EGF and pentraxin domain-containing protein 1-like [Haliotis rubra]XP_046573511.1 sushi, von Willebrand factor type A, EGF and pentraxin domain-containing protein 1-like [Haliotis rubra]